MKSVLEQQAKQMGVFKVDHRPYLKQFMMDMLCVEGNIPVSGDCQDGSSSDKKLNNKLLNRIGSFLSKNGMEESAFTYIADSAMVTEDNLKCFAPDPKRAPMYFVTRLPFSYQKSYRTKAFRSLLFHALDQFEALKKTIVAGNRGY